MKAAFSIWCAELPHPEYPPITYVNPAIPCVSLPEALKGAGYDTALFSSADLAFDRQVRFLRHRRFDVMVDRNEMPGGQERVAKHLGHRRARDDRGRTRLDSPAAFDTPRAALLRRL